MDQVLVTVSALTDVGMQRSGNEDAFLVADLTTGSFGVGPGDDKHALGEHGSLLVVSDGMGGEAAGEIASEMAVNTIRQALMTPPDAEAISERLEKSVIVANESIWNHAQQNPEYSRMGATVTAVLAHGTSAYIAQVGDSRAYLIRGELIKQLTKDQSLAQLLVDSGLIEPDQVATFPQKNVIMQALGSQTNVNVALSSVELRARDLLLLCSDGLSNKVEPQELLDGVRESSSLAEACKRLVDLANERGGEDNITVVIARFEGEALQAEGAAPTITDSLEIADQDYVSEEAADGVEHFRNTAAAVEQGREAAAKTTTDILQPIPKGDEPSADGQLPEQALAPDVASTDAQAAAEPTPSESEAPAEPSPLAAKADPGGEDHPTARGRSSAMWIIFGIISLAALAALYFYYKSR